MDAKQSKGTKKGGNCSKKAGDKAGKKKQSAGPSGVNDIKTDMSGMDRASFEKEFLKSFMEQEIELRQLQKDILRLGEETRLLALFKEEHKNGRITQKDLERLNEKLQDEFLQKFPDVRLPSTGQKPTKENIKEYVLEILTIANDKNHPFYEEAAEMARAIRLE